MLNQKDPLYNIKSSGLAPLTSEEFFRPAADPPTALPQIVPAFRSSRNTDRHVMPSYYGTSNLLEYFGKHSQRIQGERPLSISPELVLLPTGYIAFKQKNCQAFEFMSWARSDGFPFTARSGTAPEIGGTATASEPRLHGSNTYMHSEHSPCMSDADESGAIYSPSSDADGE